MTGLSIQLNRLSVGSQYLDAQEIFPAHKKSAEENLSKIFRRHVPEPQINDTTFEVQFNPGKPTLCVDGQEIALGKSRELKRVGRIARYYQHTGHLPRQEALPNEAVQSEAETKKSVRAINQASIPGANGSILAGMRLADDSLALTRNILFSVPDIGPNDPIVNHLGYYAGIFWTFFSFRELDDGVVEYKRSKSIGDAEGQRRAEARILSGGIVSTGSLAYLGGKFCDTYASTAVAQAALGVSNVLFGIGSLVAVGSSFLGAVRCERFNRRLNEYLENTGLTEVRRMEGTLKFLKESITVTPEERSELIAQIEEKHPDWSPELKEDLLQQKLADMTEVKVKYMKRRTSNKSLHLILTQADSVLAKLSNKETSDEGIKEATILINTIQTESKLKMNLYILGFIAATISFIGMLIMSFMTAGILPFVLYGIAGTIYLILTIYNIAGMFIKKDSDAKPVEIQPLLNLSHSA